MDKSKIRHILKALTWRLVASGTTFALAYIFFSNDPNAGEKATIVALIEGSLKLLFYYLHERFWFNFKTTSSKKRHLIKSITWRAIATMTTFVVAIIIFKDDPNATEKAGGLAAVEVLIKMAIYFVHEEVWYKIDYGLNREKED